MRSRKVFCIGETVLDIIFRAGQPIAAKPGGSMLNSAVSLGRTGVPVAFIGSVAADHAGEIIYGFMNENGVSTEFIYRDAGGKTTLALAFLDDRRDAGYSFYKMLPAEPLSFPQDVQPGDVVLFGSFYSLNLLVREGLIPFLRMAKSHGAFIIYDPNFRQAHLDELVRARPLILENIGLASLVRGSDEDFRHIFSAGDGGAAFAHVQKGGCPMLAYTRNRNGVEFLASGSHLWLPVPPIDPVSTIGAGDAFNAGIIHAILNHTPTPQASPNPTEWPWELILKTAIRFSENVCMSLDNYISQEFAKTLNPPNPD